MKFSNKSEIIKRETSVVKYGENKGKKNKTVYHMGFARVRDKSGKIVNRGILFSETTFSNGKKSSSLLSDSIMGRTKRDAIAKAKRTINKNKW